MEISWETLKNVSAMVSAVVIPIVLAYLGNNYTKALKEREVQAQFVKIAVDVLQATPTEANRNVREWATQVIDLYSGVPLGKEARKDLIEKVQISSIEFGQKITTMRPTKEVSEAQRILKKLGYYHGDITGNATSETVEALIQFQKQAGIPADGGLGPQTMSMLRKAEE